MSEGTGERAGERTGGATDQLVALMAGQTALPRKNGDLVFQAPWESRAFGMAVTLYDGGRYDWEEFRRRLIDEIARRERAEAAGDAGAGGVTGVGGVARAGGFAYYECWLAAFERLAVEKGLLAPAEVEARTAEYASGVRDEF